MILTPSHIPAHRLRTSSQRLQAFDCKQEQHGIEHLLGYSGFSLSLSLGAVGGETGGLEVRKVPSEVVR